ncbi:MAG: ribosomal protein S18-alanine N-acetyltransferase [Lachnospiraceae bacterium]|nr:ribosomal protein S18-alanine N-acetyltransferase [Lachnospiraceae bacterium]
MIDIRMMRKEDVPKVALMESEYFSEPWSEGAFSDALDKSRYLYMVAEESGDIVGYCGLYQVLDEGNITQVAVRKDMRGRGVGRKLLQDFMQKGCEKGIVAYTLEVRVSNQNAIRLYEVCGFETECVRKDFYACPTEDAYIMWKR